jgi:hypothetical protein
MDVPGFPGFRISRISAAYREGKVIGGVVEKVRRVNLSMDNSEKKR